ncbi:MAG: FecR family protein [Hyphomonas sp.]|uniref:FecR family protein n=1 Tax=Hyphomonas sp. TaxID=87 RepID=UPI0034A0AE2A
MKRILIFLVVLAFAAATAAYLLVSPAQAAPLAWQVTESSGAVTITHETGTVPAARGVSLKPGDAVETGADGRAVIVRGGEYLIVGATSLVKISAPDQADAKTQISQPFGSVLFKIQKKESWDFGVKTPYLAAVVKGTTFNVTVTDAGATLQVTEGEVEVSTLDGGAVDLLGPGRIARISTDDPKLLRVLGAGATEIRSQRPDTFNDAGVDGLPAADGAGPVQTANRSNNASAAPDAAGASNLSLRANGSQSGLSGEIDAPIARSTYIFPFMSDWLASDPSSIEILLGAAMVLGLVTILINLVAALFLFMLRIYRAHLSGRRR